MAEVFSLLRFLQCNDTSFPSGAFAFSNGLETLVHEDRVRDAKGILDVIQTQVLPRWLSFDRYFVRQAFECAGDLELIVAADRECHLNNTNADLARASRRIGRALLNVHSKIGTPGAADYKALLSSADAMDRAGYEPVVQGLISEGLGLDNQQAEVAALNSTLMGFVSSAVRLGKLGAIEAQGILAEVSAIAAKRLEGGRPNSPSSFSPLADIAVMRKASGGANLFAT
ncbi:MAG: urease accessory UreF family protein [Hoeflea sp.]|uniref:urease accessory protein UreF n=1 Tax=Hoeflea sp. TaxID=1940281 RepID=UPI0032EE4942